MSVLKIVEIINCATARGLNDMSRNTIKRKIYIAYRSRLNYIRFAIVSYCLDYDDCDFSFKGIIKRIVMSTYIRKRRIIMIYGDCQLLVCGWMLHNSKKLGKKYVIIGNDMIENLAGKFKKHMYSPNFWKGVNILIYNPGVPARNGIPLIDDVLEWMGDDKEIIRVTNATFKGYFPQYIAPKCKFGFTCGDKNLDRLVDEDEVITKEDINIILSEEYYSNEYVYSQYNKALNLLRIYEKKCDIKVADYIEKKGNKRILYYNYVHPKNEVLSVIADRILVMLGLPKNGLKINCRNTPNLRNSGQPVYPSVLKSLGLNPNQEQVIQPGMDETVELPLEDYMYAYVDGKKKYKGGLIQEET